MKLLAGGTYLNTKALGRPGFLSLCLAATARACSRVAWPPPRVSCSRKATIFWGSPCLTTCNSSDLEVMSASRHNSRTSSGMAWRARDSVTEVRDFPIFLAISSCL